MRISKADFEKTHALSSQIEPRKVVPAIAEALTLNIRPVLAPALVEQLLLLPDFTAAEWLPGVEVTQDTYWLRQERVYRALTDAPATQVPTSGASTTDWQYEGLPALWAVYFRPYWMQAAYCRFLPSHGFNVEKAGLVAPSDPGGTFQPISAGHRAALQAAADNTAAALLNRLLRFVHTIHAPSHAAGSCSSTPRRRRQIWGV